MPILVERPTRGVRWIARNGERSDRFDPDDAAAVRRAARSLAVEEAELRAAVAAARAELVEEAPAPVAEEVPAVRAWDLGDANATESWPDLWTALRESSRELFAWQEVEKLAALDFDVREGARFSEAEVLPLVDRQAAPLPRVGWITKSGGLRLIFEPADGLDAKQRACLYVLLTSVALDDRLIRVELLPRTRRPPLGSRMIESSQTAGVVDLAGRIRAQGGEASVTLEEIQGWLEERGLGYGRHPHDVCPIDPCPTSGQPPVLIGEDGIYCYRCAGVSARGWRPWAALVGQQRDALGHDPIAAMGIGLTHWIHARLVLRASLPTVPDGILRPGYDALLRILHPEDEDRIRRVFDPNLDFVRGAGCWLRADDLVPHDAIGPGSVRMLPWVDGHPARIDRALGSGSIPGYTTVAPVSHLIAAPEWRHPVVLVPRPVATQAEGPPLSWEECCATFRQAMPGVKIEWIQLVLGLVVGALRAQRGAPMPPISVVYAPSGSGKGAAIAAAEGILGSTRAGINLAAANAQEVGTSIGMGLESGAMILFGDELGKVRNFWEKCGPLLMLCDQHVWRKLHVGMVTTPVRAHVVLAASTLPRGLSTMPEFDRRAAIFKLPRAPSSARWEGGIEALLGVPSLTRLRESPLGSQLAEGVVVKARSMVPDTALAPWPEQAALFGGQRIMEGDEELEGLYRLVRALYALWIDPDAEPALGTGEERYPGWLACWVRAGSYAAMANAAAKAYETWNSPEDPHDERIARALRLETLDLTAPLQTTEDLRLSIRHHGQRAYVRFVNAKDSKSKERLNRDLFPAL